MVSLKVLMRSVFLCRDLFHSGRASSHHHNNKIVSALSISVHPKIDDGFSSIYMDTWPLMRTPAGCEPRIHGFSLVEHSLLPFHFRFCIFAKAPFGIGINGQNSAKQQSRDQWQKLQPFSKREAGSLDSQSSFCFFLSAAARFELRFGNRSISL